MDVVMTEAPPPYLATLRPVLKVDDMAVIYGLAEATIRRKVARGDFTPVPFGEYPYRWMRDDVIADLRARHAAMVRKQRKRRPDAAEPATPMQVNRHRRGKAKMLKAKV